MNAIIVLTNEELTSSCKLRHCNRLQRTDKHLDSHHKRLIIGCMKRLAGEESQKKLRAGRRSEEHTSELQSL
jgi:hypothetical protein